MMTRDNMELVLRNANTERMIKEKNLINLKPIVFGITALLLVIYLITSDVFALPKQKFNNIIDNYNDEIVVNISNLAGGTVK